MKAASFAARALWLLLLLPAFALAQQEVATLLSLAGTVSAQSGEGKVRILATGSPLFQGDLVMTEKDSAANLQFTDGSKLAMRSGTRLVIDRYRFTDAAPKEDSFVLRLLKGGMRTVTGLIGKRDSRDAYRVNAVTGTIGIRGTDYALLLCEESGENCGGLVVPEWLKTAGGIPAPGLYLAVFKGAIAASNNAGEREFPEPKAGYVKDINTLPVELPQDPGLANEFLGFHGLFSLMSPISGSPDACLIR